MPVIDFNRSDRVLRALKVWPFVLLPAARSIRDHETFARQHRHPCNVPEGDKLALAMISFSIVVPIEKRHFLMHSLERMLSEYRDHSIPRFGGGFRRPDFEGDHLTRGSWHRVGSSSIDPKQGTGLKYLDVCVFRDTESFLVCTFNVLPDDQLRYSFWKIVHNNYVEKIVPRPTLRKFFRP